MMMLNEKSQLVCLELSTCNMSAPAKLAQLLLTFAVHIQVRIIRFHTDILERLETSP